MKHVHTELYVQSETLRAEDTMLAYPYTGLRHVFSVQTPEYLGELNFHLSIGMF